MDLSDTVTDDLRKAAATASTARSRASSGCSTRAASAATSSPRSPPPTGPSNKPASGSSAPGSPTACSHPEEAEADGYPIDEVEKMFMRLA